MKYKYLTSILTIGFVLFTSAMSIITPDKKISKVEGRTLQVMPTEENLIKSDSKYTKDQYKEDALNGALFKKWDNYFSDHIYIRNGMVNTYTAIQGMLGQKHINDAYIGKDGYIISPLEYREMKDEQLVGAANHFNKIATKFKGSDTYVVNVPRKNMLLENKMPIPNYVAPENVRINTVIENIDANKVKVIDTRDVLNADEGIFYKTDHHLNMNGIYQSYEYIINTMNDKYPEIGEPYSKDDYKIINYKNSFTGSDARKVGKLIKYKDDLQVYKLDEFKDYEVSNHAGKTELYHESIMRDKEITDKYRVFLGGNKPEFYIKNPHAKNNLKIVMLGDSIDNPLIPLMAPHFKEIYSFDQRPELGFKKDIDTLVENINPDIIMFVSTSTYIIDAATSQLFKWNLK